jgi:hypothetical protein
MFALNVTLFVLLALSFPFVTPGSSSYYASLLAAVVLVASFVGLVYVIRACRSR